MFADKLYIGRMSIQVFPLLMARFAANKRSSGMRKMWVLTRVACCVCARSLFTDEEYLKSSLSIGYLGKQNGASEDEWTRLGRRVSFTPLDPSEISL